MENKYTVYYSSRDGTKGHGYFVLEARNGVDRPLRSESCINERSDFLSTQLKFSELDYIFTFLIMLCPFITFGTLMSDFITRLENC